MRVSAGSSLPRFLAMAAVCALPACERPAEAAPAAAPGRPLASLAERELARFLLGKAVFERLTVPEEGLGPLFNAERCSGCHDVPNVGGSGVVLVEKAARWEDGRCDLLAASGGDNLQQRATPLLSAHGIRREEAPPRANVRSSVLAPSLFGLGLVEAIPEEELASRADPDDADGDGISGRLNRAHDGTPGRFGRKAETPRIIDFVDAALRLELGLTTPGHPEEERPGGERLPEGVDPVPEPEIDERGVGLLADYVRLLAPPPREVPISEAARDSIARGEALFGEVGCASCHAPAMRTGESDAAALDRKVAHLWSDLLLHDLGEGLAGVCGPGASPSEYRTARLWGLRFRERLLHDGRASSPLEAVLLHGGEAARVRDAFTSLPSEERTLLLRFLDSL